MRVDISQVLGQGGMKIKSGTGSVTDSLKEGDVVRAKVLSSDRNGTVSLRMENGQSLNAKLNTDVKLAPGDMILLEVSGKEEGIISLSFSGVEEKTEETPGGQTNLVRDFSDKTLEPYASKLAELNMPVSEETARLMRDLIAQNPGMTLDEAAFLASNKLTGDESLMRAALAIISDGDKTDTMIARLLLLLGEQEAPANSEPGIRNPESGTQGSPLSQTADIQTGPTTALPGETTTPQFTVSPANSAPLTELLTLITGNAADNSPVSGQVAPTSEPVTQVIIPQTDGNVQINVENVEEFLNTVTNTTNQSTQVVENRPVMNPESGEPGVRNPESGVEGRTEQNTIRSPDTPPSPQSAGSSSPVNPETPSQNTQPATAQTMGSVVAKMLSELPEFNGTPPSALERFSNMLMRVAGDSAETDKDNTEMLATQLDKLFTKIGKDDAAAGARLRDAREELYTRLSLIEEAISRAAQPVRAEMLEQTQKLMEHVRLLNSINQFVYMQIPVQLNEERKSAELYLFKRKGGRRADPENVNILLAIDLENMGHWEALLNIKSKDVSIQMEVPGAPEKEHFSANTVLLHELLDEAGFKLVNTSIMYSEKETTPLTALTSLGRYTSSRTGTVDFMI